MEARILKRCALLSIFAGALANPAAAKNTVLHCKGYQPDDHHKLTEEIITLDMENKVVVSIQLGGLQPKDVIDAPLKTASKDLFQWSYDAVNMKYFYNRQNSRLRLFTNE
jgi:hypothetical protein